MPRPKKSTESGRKANEKWQQTVIAKYGEDGMREHFRQIGSLGGRATGAKGFALMSPEKRAAAGRKGGQRSSRAGVSTGEGKVKEYVKVNEEWLKEHPTSKVIENHGNKAKNTKGKI